MATKRTSTRKTTTKKTAPKASPKKTSTSESSTSMAMPAMSGSTRISPQLSFLTKLVIVLLIGTGLFYLARRYRGLLIAATVNRTAITRSELNKTLSQRYGEAVLEEMVNNILLEQAAEDEGITVSQADIDSEIGLLTEQLGGEEGLQQALVQYGLTKEDLAEQVRLRIIQERLASQLFPVEVAEEDIVAYFAENEVLYEGETLEDVSEEIRDTLAQQEVQQQFFAWFDQLKTQAQVNTYLD